MNARRPSPIGQRREIAAVTALLALWVQVLVGGLGLEPHASHASPTEQAVAAASFCGPSTGGGEGPAGLRHCHCCLSGVCAGLCLYGPPAALYPGPERARPGPALRLAQAGPPRGGFVLPVPRGPPAVA